MKDNKADKIIEDYYLKNKDKLFNKTEFSKTKFYKKNKTLLDNFSWLYFSKDFKYGFSNDLKFFNVIYFLHFTLIYKPGYLFGYDIFDINVVFNHKTNPLNWTFYLFYKEIEKNPGGFLKSKINKSEKILLTNDLIKLNTNYKELIELNEKIKEEKKNEHEQRQKADKRLKLIKERELLNQTKLNIIAKYDKDNNGIIDLIESDDFKKLLYKNERSIKSIDKKYIKNFVQICNFLKCKRDIIQASFKIIIKSKKTSILETQLNLLEEQINFYNQIVFYSISMITTLIEDKDILFNEIYLIFDKLEIFNSNWENQLKNEMKILNENINTMNAKLDVVNYNLEKISNQMTEQMLMIQKFENTLENSLNDLGDTINNSISDLNISIDEQLESVNSNLSYNNLVSTITAYQTYKINKNTKSLRNYN